MKKVLIIGSNGYIGSRLQQQWEHNYELSLVDDCWFDEPKPNTNVIDFNTLDKEYIQKHDVVILLAGHSSVKMSEGKLTSAYTNNVTNFLNLLEKIGTKQKFIYASSSSVYGDVGEDVVTENYLGFNPHNQYDITKHVIDLYAERSDIEYYGLRFGTVCGYSPTMRSDVMINAMTSSGIESGEIKLYIKDIMRPVLGINDLCNAVETIINTKKDNRGIYNLASFNLTAEEIAHGVSDVINVPVVEYATDPTNITNAKAQTKCYNFSISSTKFCMKYKFKFGETVESITKSIADNYDTIKTTKRDNIYDYEH
jgi:UDP-glucose 4-epimerase